MQDERQARRLAKQAVQLRFLHDSLGLTFSEDSASTTDPVLISIDFENTGQLLRSGQEACVFGHMGIATLDTRDLKSPSANESIISTHNFATGSHAYFEFAMSSYMFGETKNVKYGDLASAFMSLMPKSRQLILIGHDLSSELHILRHLGVDTRSVFSGLMDTARLTREVATPCNMYRLSELSGSLRVPSHSFHSAGNDAHFALRCLLLIGVRSFRESDHFREASSERLECLSRIALSDIPQQRPGKAPFKKFKRVLRSRKYQSTLWDLETQDAIGAERAARRAENEAIGVFPFESKKTESH